MVFVTRKCVGCGFCCLKAICVVGYSYLAKGEDIGEISRCPLLIWDDPQSRYLCTLIDKDKRFKSALHIDKGCCAGLNTWRREVKFRG